MDLLKINTDFSPQNIFYIITNLSSLIFTSSIIYIILLRNIYFSTSNEIIIYIQNKVYYCTFGKGGGLSDT